MGQKGSSKKQRSMLFPKWMADAIEGLAESGGHTFTDVVIELLRRELELRGYRMDIGQEPENPAAKAKVS